MIDNVNDVVVGLQPYQPGKPIEELARELGITNAIKLASNENPRGPGPEVVAALRRDDLSRYPDGSGYLLKNRLAEHLGVGVDQITLGNGSNDVLELAGRVALSPGTKGIVDEHCFVVYPLAIAAAHGQRVSIPSRDWGHDLDAMLAAIDDDTRIVFIANPNNPTGTWVTQTALVAFLRRVPDTVWVVLDEAYFEYVRRGDYPDGVALLSEFENLIVTRTFSKIHGLASLRIGYSVTTPAFADLMNRIRQPFNVNSLALAAAQAALGDGEFVRTSRELNDAGMSQICGGLHQLGLETIESAGNFVTFDCGREALPIYDALLRLGVIVRPVGNYGMPNHLRVTVGLPEENDRFLEAIRKVS